MKELVLYLKTRKIFKKLNKSRLTYKEYNYLINTVEALSYTCQNYRQKNQEGFSKKLKEYQYKNNSYKSNLFDKIILLYLNSRINKYSKKEKLLRMTNININMLSSRLEYL